MKENEFLKYYSETKDKLNQYLKKYNDNIKREENELIKENLNVFSNLNSDGKLIRGTLVNLGYKLIKDSSEYSYPLALSFEIFQTSILVHDDIIDNDNLRRGKPTIHAYNYDKYKDKKISDSIAICMGDLGLYEANQMIAKNYKNDPNLGEVLTYFNDIVIKTIKGEIIDVTLPFLEENKLLNSDLEENIMLIYKLKTAYYTIIGPLSLGIILANGKKDYLKEIEALGLKIGIAFQIQDDILGIYSDDLGKIVGSDIEEFKQTILYSYTKKNKKYYNELLNYYGKEINEYNLLKVREIYINSGAYKYANDLKDKLYDEAIVTLENIKWIKKEDKQILKNFILYLKNRKK